ncbi:18435_t:CDS:2 [Racocetra fulgida]|uniref:18435_t:CDS:1 n=1 Tax=Racocetra fulgida TaxID=60492 RepID=A0A9N9EAQ6_9GLOM|nr:18435_t:CDS:2 [Racocetra fulgida]
MQETIKQAKDAILQVIECLIHEEIISEIDKSLNENHKNKLKEALLNIPFGTEVHSIGFTASHDANEKCQQNLTDINLYDQRLDEVSNNKSNDFVNTKKLIDMFKDFLTK